MTENFSGGSKLTACFVSETYTNGEQFNATGTEYVLTQAEVNVLVCKHSKTGLQV